jgi:hypothetical protein
VEALIFILFGIMYYYHAFHLKIKSELRLPEVQVAVDRTFDVSIVFGEVSQDGLLSPMAAGAFYQSNTHEFWLNVPGVARYLVQSGNQMTITPYAGSDEDSIRLFLLGSCLGALLMQRDVFLLHANAIKIGAQSVSFAGCSGIGKSTLSAAFMQRGHAILSDDICAVNALGVVMPGLPYIKLWADASQQLGIETKTLKRIRPKVEKFSVPLNTQFCAEALPLKVLYVLNQHAQDVFEFKPIEGMKKFLPFKNNTYRYGYIKGMGKATEHLKRAGTLASSISVVRILRPKSGFRLDELMDLIEADLSMRGIVSV